MAADKLLTALCEALFPGAVSVCWAFADNGQVLGEIPCASNRASAAAVASRMALSSSTTLKRQRHEHKGKGHFSIISLVPSHDPLSCLLMSRSYVLTMSSTGIRSKGSSIWLATSSTAYNTYRSQV